MLDSKNRYLSFRFAFQKCLLARFRLGSESSFQPFLEKAVNILLPFCTTRVYKVAISVLTIMKSKYRSTSKNVSNALCPDALNIQPRHTSL